MFKVRKNVKVCDERDILMQVPNPLSAHVSDLGMA